MNRRGLTIFITSFLFLAWIITGFYEGAASIGSTIIGIGGGEVFGAFAEPFSFTSGGNSFSYTKSEWDESLPKYGNFFPRPRIRDLNDYPGAPPGPRLIVISFPFFLLAITPITIFFIHNWINRRKSKARQKKITPCSDDWTN